jgi:hypothetical protein
MEQLVFHTRRSKLSLNAHHQRFQDYLESLTAADHLPFVNEEIIITTQHAINGINKYMNVL